MNKVLLVLLLVALPGLAQTRSVASTRVNKTGIFPINKSGGNLCAEFSGELTGNWFCADAPSGTLTAAAGMTLTPTAAGNIDSPFYRSGKDKGPALAGSFDGATSRLTTSNAASPTGDFSCWSFFRTDVTANVYQPVITKAKNGNYEFQMYRNGAVAEVSVDLYSSTSAFTTFTSPSNLLTGGWHFVVFAYHFVADGSSVGTVWLDGTAGTTISTAHGPMFAESIPWRVMSQETSARFTQGALMGAGCTEKTLSAATIGKMARAVFGGRGLTALAVAASDAPTYEVPVVTTRSSAARFVSNGQVASVGTGVPRITQDGASIEQARTNIALQSEDITTTWAPAAASTTLTGNTTVAPNGQTTADSIIENNVGVTFYGMNQAVTLANATAYVMSLFVKKDTTSEPYIVLDFVDTQNHYGIFDLGTGQNTAVGNGGGLSPVALSTEVLAGGWYRIAIRFTTTQTSNSFQVYTNTSATALATHAGVINSTVYVWGAQLEAGTDPSGYIPTTTTTVSRAAESDVAAVSIAPKCVSGTWNTPSVLRAGAFLPRWAAMSTDCTATATFDAYAPTASPSTLNCTWYTAGTSRGGQSASNFITASSSLRLRCQNTTTTNIATCLGTTCENTATTSFSPATMTSFYLGSYCQAGFEPGGTIQGYTYGANPGDCP